MTQQTATTAIIKIYKSSAQVTLLTNKRNKNNCNKHKQQESYINTQNHTFTLLTT